MRATWPLLFRLAGVLLLVLPMLGAASVLSSCGAGRHVATGAEAEACRRKGDRIIDTTTSCPAIVRKLDELVRDEPVCRDVFGPGATSEQSCPSDGGVR